MIKCLENIPEKWKVGRVKDIFYISKDKAHQKDPVILSLSRDGIKVRDISNNEGQIAESYENYNPVKPGDLLLNPMDLYSGANCNMSLVEGVISPAYVNLRKKYKNISPKFYDYYFKVQYWTMNMFAHGKGVSFDNRWTLNTEGVLNFEIPILSGEEQQKIADFLDKKCSQIEKLIKLQENEIDKLQEYRDSIVFKATTEGFETKEFLDLKSDWFSKIPLQWKFIQTKQLFDIIAGATPDSSNAENWDGIIKWITPADYKTEDVYVKEGKRNLSEQGYSSCSTTLIPKGNIIFSKRAPIGLVAINLEELCTNQGCLSCVAKKPLNIKFFYYQMSIHTKLYELLGSGTTFKEISAQKFGSFKLFVPPLEEQNKIVEQLDKKCNDIQNLIKIKLSKINKLVEYKKSLIYECVTGKKEI